MLKMLTPQMYLAPMKAKAMAPQHVVIHHNSQQNNTENAGITVIEGNQTELSQHRKYRAMHVGENRKEIQRDGELGERK